MWNKENKGKLGKKIKNGIDKIKKMQYTSSCPEKTGHGQWKKEQRETSVCTKVHMNVKREK